MQTRFVRQAVDDVAALGVEIIQFASDNSSHFRVLHQMLLEGDYVFYGLAMVYEWVYDHREVVSFQGDGATMVLMSEPMTSLAMAPSSLEVPASTCAYLWYVAVAATRVLVVVAIGTVAYTLLGGSQLDHFELL
ncbi:hypothetical protein SPRG_17384 [Saprolegnia parasitica CBS 223.65]|uniref:Uncharacterized protein n=1 Tax=Saprolegnia parasitica (strain CBS 223.65) TaxID=695850 RepID=A0A067BFS7_SAPPC|nr:hypothetical protein SPRG_17384 [Saprolegnia parasitica CBS 223.65]KDO17209.1 hypothetical protein SPRG_17384 [Saprolegnia parasitica CBS 223.65]|eukprot:XP_012212083.1 hypothetical protein SPRG_17384 [Saprolegnia parasitica CBS 223.65]